MNPRLLLVEDEPGLVLTLTDRLRAHGYRVEACASGREALRRMAAQAFDLVVLDIMLPDSDGFEVCRRLRERDPHTPVLMLTARDAVEDRVRGLRSGADDYLGKPFDAAELLARLDALLRRSGQMPGGRSGRLRFGAVEINLDAATCHVDGEEVDLSARLYRLLCHFAENPGVVLSRDRLLNDVWGYDALPTTRTVDVHISWLRQRIEADPKNPVHLITVHGLGYKLVP
jgi:two-component system, OmpR family, alkaline phosphatase synthesis response regulator PhoP